MQQPEEQPQTNHFIGIFTLAMISISAIISLRNLPTTALLGTKSISFFLAAGLFFFIPIALVCAELSAGWPQKGGMYLWVKKAFGVNWGVLVIWLEWIGSVVWLPGILSFLASTTTYLFKPDLEENRFVLISFMLLFLWGGTFINFRGIRISSQVSTIGVLVGAIIPAIILIALGFTEFGNAISNNVLNFEWDTLLPAPQLSALVIFTSMLLSFSGMEIPAYYVQYVKKPQKNYPRAIFLATSLILAISLLGSLAIASVIPKEKISLVGGAMQSFQYFFNAFQIGWATPLLAALMLAGGFALLNTWLIGPSRGLLAIAQAGHIPGFFKRTNKKGVPTALLWTQAITGTFLLLFYVFNPTIKGAYWLLNTLAAQIYLIMYAMVFLAAVYLRFKMPEHPRPFKVPGGKVGICIVGGLGAVTCFLAILIGFVPPCDVDVQIPKGSYSGILLSGIAFFCLPPLIYLKKYKQ